MKSYFKPIKLTKAEQKKADIAWHDEVVDLAGRQCEVCKQEFLRSYLCSHHIKSKGSHPELRHDVSNGVSVCMRCHNLLHSGEIKL